MKNKSVLRKNNLVFKSCSAQKAQELRAGDKEPPALASMYRFALAIEYMESVEIFTQPSVNGLSEAKDIFHDPVGMFYFAAYSGFAVLNMPLPVNGVV